MQSLETITGFSLLGRWGESTPLAKKHPIAVCPHLETPPPPAFIPCPINNNFHVISNKKFIFSCSIAPVPFLF